MKTREAVLGFHYAERVKSQLLQLQRLMEILFGQSGEAFVGGKAMIAAFMDGIRGDLLGSRNVAPHIQWERAVLWLDRTREELEGGKGGDPFESLSQCISSVTTVSQQTMEILLEREIL